MSSDGRECDLTAVRDTLDKRVTFLETRMRKDEELNSTRSSKLVELLHERDMRFESRIKDLQVCNSKLMERIAKLEATAPPEATTPADATETAPLSWSHEPITQIGYREK